MACKLLTDVLLLFTEYFLWVRQPAGTATDVNLFTFHSSAMGGHVFIPFCMCKVKTIVPAYKLKGGRAAQLCLTTVSMSLSPALACSSSFTLVPPS